MKVVLPSKTASHPVESTLPFAAMLWFARANSPLSSTDI
jgi:hypothetical protein